jgi:hypothetical protein
VYDFQRDYQNTIRLAAKNGIIELPEEYQNCEALRVYDATGFEYEPRQMGRFIQMASPHKTPGNGEVVELLFRQPMTTVIEEAVLEYLGNGFYRVPGVLSDPSVIEGAGYRAPGDIVGIDAVFDDHGEEADAVEYCNDTVKLDDAGKTRPLTAFGIEYIKPLKFFVLSQNLEKEDQELLSLHVGDALSTFPYFYDVAEGDVVTVFSGSNTKKTVLDRREADDILPDYFVSGVSYLETAQKEYCEGRDFVIIGGNKIHWTCAEPPAGGEKMSVFYQAFPTYRVVKNIPQLRTSEDQRIPRKSVLKLFAAFQESRDVNRVRAAKKSTEALP